MATETVASAYTSTADEPFEKKANEEAIGQKDVSLSNESEGKHDKDENAQVVATPSSKTEDEKKGEAALAEIEKSNDSPALEASAEDNLEYDKIEPPTDVAVEKTDDSASKPGAAKSQLEEPPPPTEPTENTETEEEKQQKTTHILEASAESESSTQAKQLVETEAVAMPESENSETSTQKVEKPEPVITEVQKISEKEFQEKAHDAEQTNIVEILDPSAEINEKPSDATEEKTTEAEFDARPKEAEKAQLVVTEIGDNPSVPEKQSLRKEEKEQLKTVILQTEAESAEKRGDTIEVHPPQKSDIEGVKETSNSNSEAVPVKAEKPELVNTEVQQEPKEQLAPVNLVPSRAIAEKIVELEEDGKKESSSTNDIEGLPKEEVGFSKHPEQASEVKTNLEEERENSAPTNSVEEKKVAANDDEKQPFVEGSSREAKVEIKKVEEKNEAMTDEAGDVKADSVKQEQAETKTNDEVVTAAGEHVRETLASKFEGKEAESIQTGVDNLKKEQIEDPNVHIAEPPRTKESDPVATQTSKDLPTDAPLAKPAQKHSNNILSKVKQSLVKAKKAITGKSPTSKTLSSEAKGGDIKVK